MKGLILSGGKGSRLRPLTYTGAKQLVPIANKPVLFYAIEALVQASITDLGIVVGETADQIKAAVGDGSRFGAKVTYIPQDAPLGLAHAVKVSRAFLGGERFVMFLGDNFIKGGIVPFVRAFRESKGASFILLSPVKTPQDFGVAEVQDGRVLRLVEKPREPRSNLALVGVYLLDSRIFEAVDAIKPSARGELEITDAIQWLVEHGCEVRPQVLEGGWIDTGKKDDLLDANRLLLEDIEPHNEGNVDAESKLHGRVVLQRGARLTRSVVRGPAIIGEETELVNAYVGPFTAIYHHCRVEGSEIEHSIVLEHSSIVDVPHRIANSLIGRYVEVRKGDSKPRAYELLLGDHSRVGVV